MKLTTVLLIIIMMAVLLSPACGPNKPPQTGSAPDKSAITEGVMTTSVDDDSKPTSPVKTAFSPDTQAIYCSFKVSGVTQEDLIKASWYYIKGEAVDKVNQLLDGGEMYTSGQADGQGYYLAFYEHMPAAGWYKGSYNVVLSINGADKLSIPFNIE
jgi:glucan-binding YG repeat protein